MRKLLLLPVLLASIGLLSCGGETKKPASVTIMLKEWAVMATPAEVKPGKVEFNVINSGSRAHQLLVIKSDLPSGQLPLTDVVVDESKVNIAGSVATLQPGGGATVSMDLFPGKYLLICNLVDRNASGPPDPHYLNGMVTLLVVLDR